MIEQIILIVIICMIVMFVFNIIKQRYYLLKNRINCTGKHLCEAVSYHKQDQSEGIFLRSSPLTQTRLTNPFNNYSKDSLNSDSDNIANQTAQWIQQSQASRNRTSQVFKPDITSNLRTSIDCIPNAGQFLNGNNLIDSLKSNLINQIDQEYISFKDPINDKHNTIVIIKDQTQDMIKNNNPEIIITQQLGQVQERLPTHKIYPLNQIIQTPAISQTQQMKTDDQQEIAFQEYQRKYLKDLNDMYNQYLRKQLSQTSQLRGHFREAVSYHKQDQHQKEQPMRSTTMMRSIASDSDSDSSQQLEQKKFLIPDKYDKRQQKEILQNSWIQLDSDPIQIIEDSSNNTFRTTSDDNKLINAKSAEIDWIPLQYRKQNKINYNYSIGNQSDYNSQNSQNGDVIYYDSF